MASPPYSYQLMAGFSRSVGYRPTSDHHVVVLTGLLILLQRSMISIRSSYCRLHSSYLCKVTTSTRSRLSLSFLCVDICAAMLILIISYALGCIGEISSSPHHPCWTRIQMSIPKNLFDKLIVVFGATVKGKRKHTLPISKSQARSSLQRWKNQRIETTKSC